MNYLYLRFETCSLSNDARRANNFVTISLNTLVFAVNFTRTRFTIRANFNVRWLFFAFRFQMFRISLQSHALLRHVRMYIFHEKFLICCHLTRTLSLKTYHYQFSECYRPTITHTDGTARLICDSMNSEHGASYDAHLSLTAVKQATFLLPE